MGGDLGQLLGWLRGRRPEIETMVLARVQGVSGPVSPRDPEHLAGVRGAISAGLGYGLAGFEHGEERAGPVPAAILAQARCAARSRVELDVVLRCYVAGSALLGDYVAQGLEGHDFDLRGVDLRRIWRIQGTLLDRALSAVAAEYRKETGGRLRTGDERRLARVKRLLAGHLLEPDGLQYELDAWHIAAIAQGPGAPAAIRDLAARLDRRLLLVPAGDGMIWAWFGGQRKISAAAAAEMAPQPWPPGLSLALGEPEQGVAGWRLSHRQARAALPISSRPTPRLVRYAEVSLLAAALHDEILANSLQRLYLDPLADERDGGVALRRTLRAYFLADRNVSSTAAVLGLSRQTVSSRLRVAEKRISRPLDTCAPELDTALRLEELGGFEASVNANAPLSY